MKVKLFTLFFLTLFLTFIDSSSKGYVKTQFNSINQNSLEEPIQVIKLFSGLNLVNLCNFGISFGLLSRLSPPILKSIILLAACVVTFYGIYLVRKGGSVFPISFVISGALANIIDRLKNKCVYDFIDFYVNDWHWYAFNLADTFITIGGVFFILNKSIQGKKFLKL